MTSSRDNIMAPILIAGPTASGKSALAMALAEKFSGEIVNADSMQVYHGLPLLSAIPSPEMQAAIAHHLYAHVKPNESYSVGRWLADLEMTLQGLHARGRRPIIIGGTGLYFRAAEAGLVDLPDIPAEIRAELDQDLAGSGLSGLYARLQELDPELAARLHPHDRQRIMRGLEVVRATGKPLSAWQKSATAPALIGEAIRLCLMPDRAWLYARCDERFDMMVSMGALEEVAAFETAYPNGMGPRRTLGYEALSAVLAGHMALEQAIDQAKMQTRRYAKRQMTWIRNQMITWNRLSEKDYYNNMPKILSEISKKGLT